MYKKRWAMRREITLGLILMLVFSSLSLFSGNASATIKKEDMVWLIGDKWEVRYTTVSANMTMIFTMTMEVKSESNVEIDGISYDAYVADVTGQFESVNMPGLNFSLASGSMITGKTYVAKDNDKTMKTAWDMIWGLEEEKTGKFFNFTQTVVTTNRAISGGSPDVIDVGTNWISTIKTVTITTTTISGSAFQPGYTNTTATSTNTTNTYNYECTAQKSITTTAGTFQTYEITRNTVGAQGYMLQYGTSEVKMDVKDVQYDNNGNIISLVELISYEVTPNSSITKKTPGFESAIIICSIAMILLWKRKRIG